MHNDIGRIVGNAAQAIAKKTRGAGFAGAIVTFTGGKRALAWRTADASADDKEKMAIALLDSVANQSAESAASCEACAIREARARAAIVALQGDGSQLAPPHDH